MAAPAGNKFWTKRAKSGRDKIFECPIALKEAAYQYFEYEFKNLWGQHEAIKGGEFSGQLVDVTKRIPFTLQGLCIFLDVNTKYFNHFEAALKTEPQADAPEYDYKRDKDFSNVITHIRDIIDKQKLDGALVGAYNGTIVSKLTGLVERTETALTGKDGGAINVKMEQITGIIVE